jgi:hypothetical protein
MNGVNPKIWLVIAGVWLSISGIAAAVERYVPSQYSTIQAAVDAAVNGDTVIIAPGTYTGYGNTDIDFKGKAIMVRSETGPESCIIDCQGAEEEPHRGFYFHNNEGPDSVLSGLTIINGWADDGGGIYCSESSPTVKNCIFSGNSSVDFGGGMFCQRNCSLNLSNCAFVKNSARRSGDGLFVSHYCSLILTNCSLTGNSSINSGDTGGGLYNAMYVNAYLNNCIIWGNTSGSGTGHEIYTGFYSTLSINYCDIHVGSTQIYNVGSTIEWGDGNIYINPLLALDGYHLLSSSPCINAGDPAGDYSEQTDIDGEQRVMLDRVDMGADEFNPFEVTFDVVGKRRIGRTIFEYDCNVTLTNISRFTVRGVQLEIVKASENMVIIDPNVAFDDVEIGPGESAISIDTCTFQVDRSEAIEPAQIVWKVKCQREDTGMPLELTINGVGSEELESISDLAYEGENGFEDLAALAGRWLWAGEAGTIPEDVTNDGIVNLRDFAVLSAQPQHLDSVSSTE